jgi:hypothetical protein
MGMGFVGAYGAKAATDELQNILKQKFEESQKIAAVERQAQALQQRQAEAEADRGLRERQMQQQQRQFDMTQERLSAPEPPRAPGVHVVGGHLVDDSGTVVFSPPEKPAVVKAPGVHVVSGNLVDDTGKVIFRAPDKTTPNAKLVHDDPALPRGVQSYIATLGSRGNYDEALKELTATMPQLLADHPNMSPQKAVAALQGASRAPIGTATHKTPEQIKAESAARAEGTATGKKAGGGGEFSTLSKIAEVAGWKDEPSVNPKESAASTWLKANGAPDTPANRAAWIKRNP